MKHMERRHVIFNDTSLALLWLMTNPKGHLSRENGDEIWNHDGNSKLVVEKWSDFFSIGSKYLETDVISYEDFVHDYRDERLVGKAVV